MKNLKLLLSAMLLVVLSTALYAGPTEAKYATNVQTASMDWTTAFDQFLRAEDNLTEAQKSLAWQAMAMGTEASMAKLMKGDQPSLKTFHTLIDNLQKEFSPQQFAAITSKMPVATKILSEAGPLSFVGYCDCIFECNGQPCDFGWCIPHGEYLDTCAR